MLPLKRVLLLCLGLAAAPLQAQAPPQSMGSRFFQVLVTRNAKPLLAEAFFHENDGTLNAQGLPLAAVIARAYGLEDFQVVDGPDWIHASHLYDIEALPPPSFVAADEQAMLQTMLADRFGLEVARETRDMSLLVLSLDAATPRLPPADAEASHELRLYPRGGMGGMLTGMHGSATLAQLARLVGRILRQPVLDRSGLEGEYAIALDGFAGGQVQAMAAAIRGQLGLVLARRTVQVEVLRVVRADPPRLDS